MDNLVKCADLTAWHKQTFKRLANQRAFDTYGFKKYIYKSSRLKKICKLVLQDFEKEL